MNVDAKLLLDTFDSSFISRCYEVKRRYLGNNDGFNDKAGEYGGHELYNIYTQLGLKPLLDVFYIPNIEVLDFIVKNLDEFKNKTFLDYGCGLGFLTIFLNYLGIDAYCYDNFIQASTREQLLNCINEFTLWNKYVKVDKRNEFDVITLIGSHISDEGLFIKKPQYCIFNNHNKFSPEWLSLYTKIEEYPWPTYIYKYVK